MLPGAGIVRVRTGERSAVGLATMEDASDFEGISDVDKEKPVVGDTEPEFVAPLKRFHVALACADEAIKR